MKFSWFLALAAAAAMLTGTGCDNRDVSGATNPHRDSAVSGRSASPTADPHDDPRLHGKWVAENVDAGPGGVRIRLTFRRDGAVRILATSELPFIGEVKDKTGDYRVEDGTITSQAIRDGTTVAYRFDDRGRLIIEYQEGEEVPFKRDSQGTGNR